MATPNFKLSVNSEELTLIDFDGIEAMNRLFEYRFTCEAPSSGTTLKQVLNLDAEFVIKEYDTSIFTGDITIHGYISKVSRKNGCWILTFLPKLQKSSTNSKSEIFFKNDASLNVKKIIDYEIDKDISLDNRTFINNVTEAGLPGRKLFCQYNESNFNFVARLCDYWGIQFYFDHFESNIVFANESDYDQEITVELLTKLSEADNHKLKIKDWHEVALPATSYIKITGHDYNNASIDISSQYPSDNIGGLTETRITNSGINSQEEADYLSQIRYEENNCLNEKASGIVSIPYCYPGFLLNTDDENFPEAVVIKTIHRGRNLNSTNSGEAITYECEIEMIPADVIYRSKTYYPIPQATTVIGQIVTDTTDITVAQRNETGEYKVKLLGFENESDVSTDPWVRKAQTTGGSNSVDIPLTPNTEVLLAFVDNNPNCPYIQHAMDNSLHPVPVNSVNAHHAVISTDGMLVTSSLQGRYNLSTTRNEERVADSDISSTVKNYFTNRGDFNQNVNFIDPSDNSTGFTPEDRASGHYITQQFYGDQIQIAQGDRLHWHNGNLYDFGGYWNFNLGNSYEENFIDQEAPLRIKVNKGSLTSGDLLLNNGPDWNRINFSQLQAGGLNVTDVTPASYGNTDIGTDRDSKTFQVNTGGAWSADGMNVSKSYNASYDYKFGDAIDVSDRVNTLEVKHTDSATESIEMAFHNGVLRSWEKTVGRVKNEKKWASNGNLTYEGFSETNSDFVKTETETQWDVKGNEKISESKTIEKDDSISTDVKSYNFNTGALAAHNIKKTDGMGTAEMDFSYGEKAISTYEFGGTKSFSISAAGDASIAISFSGALQLDIEFAVLVKLEMGKSLKFEYESHPAMVKMDVAKTLSFRGHGITIENRPSLGISKKVNEIKAMETEIKKVTAKLEKAEFQIHANSVYIHTGQIVMGMP